MHALAKAAPHAVLEVSYEGMLVDSAHWIQKIADFLEVDCTVRMEDGRSLHDFVREISSFDHMQDAVTKQDSFTNLVGVKTTRTAW